MWKLVITVALLCATVGCKTMSATDYSTAVIQSDDDNMRQAIQQGINQLFNGIDVTLAKNAFVERPWIVIERAQIKNLQGNLTSGVVQPAPEKVVLRTDGEHCYLVLESSNKTIKLESHNCQKVVE